jgi:cephalosporin-C deacetylase-like acetyl esterase
VDDNRIGIWGSSYSGAHVLVVGAIDRRIRCVVSQVPLISGHRSARRLLRSDMIAAVHSALRA